jgi:hypothetical protein
MTSLRRRMIEDMQVRNLSQNNQSSYVHQISRFARYFGASLEALGPDQIRAYQVYLTNEKQLAPSSIIIAMSALRFLYRVTLHKEWGLSGGHSYAQEAPEVARRAQPRGSPPASCLHARAQASNNPNQLLRSGLANLRSHRFESDPY